MVLSVVARAGSVVLLLVLLAGCRDTGVTPIEPGTPCALGWVKVRNPNGIGTTCIRDPD